MSIYTPYFYIIQDVRNGMYYAGAKWAQDANPSSFMVEGGYTTSSKIVNELICEYGLCNFIIRKIKTFETGQEAYDYETKFLQRVDARINPKFYNNHNNKKITPGTEEFKNKIFNNFGVDNVFFLDETHEKAKITKIEKYGNENYNNREKAKKTKQKRYGNENYNNAKKNKKTKEERYGDENYNNREKANKTFLDKYGAKGSFAAPQIIEKAKKTKEEKYGDKNYNNREKAKRTWMDLYGVSHPNKTPMNRQRLKESALSRDKKKLNRKIVNEIIRYREVYGRKLKLGRGWFRKSDEYLNQLLKDVVEKFGEI